MAKKKVAKKKAKKHHALPPPPAPIEINIITDAAGNLTVDRDHQHVSKAHPPQEVLWKCNDPEGYMVYFYKQNQRKPFNDRLFHRGNPRSGVPVGDDFSTHKYLVAAFGQFVDPDVIIDP